MKLIKNGDVVDFVNQGTIDAYKAAGYVEQKEPKKKPVKNPQTKKPANE